MSCPQCEKIKVRDSFPDSLEYARTIRLLKDMEDAGEIEVTYATCPFDDVFGQGRNRGKFYAKRMFHQVRCTKCGEIYGLICDVELGDAQLKVNAKVFDPKDYPDHKSNNGNNGENK